MAGGRDATMSWIRDARSGWPTMTRRQRSMSTGGKLFWMMLGLAAGTTVMFVLDPRAGKRRRALARDKVVHLGNSMDELVNERIPSKMEYLSGVARGARYRSTPHHDGGQLPDDDQFITDRVMSIVFRDPNLPKGDINVNTVDQVVYLHGHVDDAKLVQEIEQRVRKVEGVRDVVNVINRPDVDPSQVRADEVRRAEQRG